MTAYPDQHPPTLMEELKAATGPMHARLEATPFFPALAAGQLALESYVGQLRALAVIHSVLEHALQECADERVTAVWQPDMRKFALLQQDLQYFEPRAVADLREAAEIALQTAEHLRLRAIGQPLALLGSMYVLEGSTLGAAVVRPLVARAFLLAGDDGLAYLRPYGDHAPARWSAFRERMNALTLSAEDRAGIVREAVEFFGRLETLFIALHPFSPESRMFLVTSINPEAGRHAVTADPREREAAIRAGDRCWARHPYFDQRYGERGRRFTRSDGAWQATLVHYEPARISQQVKWLGRVLAARGMPGVLLEEHLEILADELTAAIPTGKSAYDKLRTAAAELRTARHRHLKDDQLEALDTEFDRTADPEWSVRLPHTGRLLACAVCDEREGSPLAVKSLHSWLTDPRRFPLTWVTAVDATIAQAREVAGLHSSRVSEKVSHR